MILPIQYIRNKLFLYKSILFKPIYWTCTIVTSHICTEITRSLQETVFISLPVQSIVRNKIIYSFQTVHYSLNDGYNLTHLVLKTGYLKLINISYLLKCLFPSKHLKLSEHVLIFMHEHKVVILLSYFYSHLFKW